MTIQDIKSSLDILEVGQNLGIEIDKRTKKAKCPFHPDKKPSLQFSQDKQIATCFSGNCTAGTMDVISLVEKKLGTTTAEAINHLKDTFSISEEKQKIVTKPKSMEIGKPNYAADYEQMQSSYISSSIVKKYATERKLDPKKLSLGYNAFKEGKFKYVRGCMTFGLKNEQGKIVSIYGRSVRNNNQSKHYYTKDRKGLYPNYPKPETKQLILTESIIDAATLLSIPSITKHYEILALYGTNGLVTEHIQALQQLENLQEIILFLDGDQAGRAATEKHGQYLQQTFPSIKISAVNTLENEDINSIAQSHDPKAFTQLLKERILFTSTEIKKAANPIAQTPNGLNTKNPNRITHTTETAVFTVRGGLRKDLDSLKITLEIRNMQTHQKICDKVELYEYKQVEKYARVAAEKLNLRVDLLEHDLNILTDLLDKHREENQQKGAVKKEAEQPLTESEKKEYIAFGKQENLLQKIDALIGKSGVVGESSNRLFLFVGAVSHRMHRPLNIVIQGSSGSGKSYLIKKISHLVPQAKVRRYTRLSEKSFYNFGEYDLCNTLIIIEDYDGMNEDVEYAFRELQSNGELISAVSSKEFENSDIKTQDKIVKGPIASMVATTRGEVYHDNSTRVFFIAVDESKEQTQKIIAYKNQKASGKINDIQETQSQQYLQGFAKTLNNCPVVNPYLQQIQLPVPNEQLRRLHELLESFCQQITLIHQHQRKRSPSGALITEKEDMKIAIDLLFESILLKVDELDGSLRNFYEKLKKYVLNKSREYEFIQREIRQQLKISKTQLFRYMHQLEGLEYIQRKGRGSNGATQYKIIYWDDNQKLRTKIQTTLNNQLNQL